MKQTVLFLLFWASVQYSYAQQTVVTVELPNPCAPTIGVEDYENPLRIKLFPNPTDGIINLTAFNTSGFNDAELKIFDVKGSMIYQTTIKKMTSFIDLTLDISFISNGIYTLSLVTKEALVTEKLILNR